MSVRTDGDAGQIVLRAVQDGWEPHFVVAYGNYSDALTVLGHLYDIPVEKYGFDKEAKE